MKTQKRVPHPSRAICQRVGVLTLRTPLETHYFSANGTTKLDCGESRCTTTAPGGCASTN